MARVRTGRIRGSIRTAAVVFEGTEHVERGRGSRAATVVVVFDGIPPAFMLSTSE